MAPEYAVDGAQSLFTIPQPLDKSLGRTTPGPSYGISGSRKRKRAEMVLGIDGEAINIYDIKNSKLLTSHAIAPQAYICSPPLCILCKDKERQRFTYAAIRNELAVHKHQLYCFRENTLGSSRLISEPKNSPEKSTRTLGSKDDPTVLLDAIPSHGSPVSHNVVVVQRSSALTGLSADLSEEHWQTTLTDLEREAGDKVVTSRSVKYAFCLTGTEARLGLLKGRVDLVPVLEQEEETNLLCLLTLDQDDEYNVHILMFQPHIQGVSRSPLRTIIKWSLPKSANENLQSQTNVQFKYDTEAGLLYQLIAGSLITYSSSTLGLKINSELTIPQELIHSFAPLRQDLMFVATSTHYRLVNTRYLSIQASTPVLAADAGTQTYRKRKRSSHENASTMTVPTCLLDYFSTESTVIGMQSHTLVGFPIRMPSQKRGSRLIDSLGRGIPLSSAHTTLAPQVPTASAILKLAESDPTLTKLCRHLTSHEPIALSGAVEAIKHLLRSFNSPRPVRIAQTHLLTNGTGPSRTQNVESEDPADAVLALEDAAVTAELVRATSLLSSTALEARSKGLQSAISLLGNNFPSQDVSRAMRDQLERREIMFLIELLLVDLEQGGWTGHILDIWPNVDGAEANDSVDDAQNGAIAVVARLLTRAVDALGMGAWLASAEEETTIHSQPDDDENADAMSIDKEHTPRTHSTLTALRDEVSAVLECSQEAAWFSNFLFEFLRYENAVKTSFNPLAKTSAGTAALGQSALPLGARTVKGVAGTTVKAGGVVKPMSQRQLGYELSKRVGVYTFERVRF